MKIVHVVESTATGTLSVVCMISNRLASEGHEVYVVFSKRSETPDNLASLFHPDVHLRQFQMKGRPMTSILFGLRRELNSLRPDIVHLHSSFAGFLGRLSTILSLKSARFFYSPHCISFMRSDVSRLKKTCFIGLEALACLKKSTYVACSESERAIVRRYLRTQVVLVENALDKQVAANHPNASTQERPLPSRSVVTVGGIRRQKNPELFAEIARLFKRQDVEFVWIGDGDEATKKVLEQANVRVTGWLSRTDAMERVKGAEVYLSTSSWEGMPISIIEAMALGTAIVASGCSGNIDVLRHARTGMIFSSAEEAVSTLTRMMDDDDFRKAIAENAQDEVRRRFSEDRFFDDITALYETQMT
ncbi:glycosyltransferase [Paraburkholderia dioscoreae]|uniref:Glycosyl transferase n=1 Tax=Paraburkholderia dioscoreae TaxID=2604047 RepID=A0A5Q4YSM6_9BURK|nr:glycosyltransferase [Paraburkholderia dioscoreae]VVD27263.1 Glycosyl transferase [Paraburkholderia dioscoreae]